MVIIKAKYLFVAISLGKAKITNLKLQCYYAFQVERLVWGANVFLAACLLSPC